MRVELFFILGTLVVFTSCGWRSSGGDAGVYELSRGRNSSLPKLTIGLIVPHTNFGVRAYTKAVNRTIRNLNKGHTKEGARFTFLDKYDFTQHLIMMTLTPSPTGT